MTLLLGLAPEVRPVISTNHGRKERSLQGAKVRWQGAILRKLLGYMSNRCRIVIICLEAKGQEDGQGYTTFCGS